MHSLIAIGLVCNRLQTLDKVHILFILEKNKIFFSTLHLSSWNILLNMPLKAENGIELRLKFINTWSIRTKHTYIGLVIHTIIDYDGKPKAYNEKSSAVIAYWIQTTNKLKVEFWSLLDQWKWMPSKHGDCKLIFHWSHSKLFILFLIRLFEQFIQIPSQIYDVRWQWKCQMYAIYIIRKMYNIGEPTCTGTFSIDNIVQYICKRYLTLWYFEIYLVELS